MRSVFFLFIFFSNMLHFVLSGGRGGGSVSRHPFVDYFPITARCVCFVLNSVCVLYRNGPIIAFEEE